MSNSKGTIHLLLAINPCSKQLVSIAIKTYREAHKVLVNSDRKKQYVCEKTYVRFEKVLWLSVGQPENYNDHCDNDKTKTNGKGSS